MLGSSLSTSSYSLASLPPPPRRCPRPATRRNVIFSRPDMAGDTQIPLHSFFHLSYFQFSRRLQRSYLLHLPTPWRSGGELSPLLRAVRCRHLPFRRRPGTPPPHNHYPQPTTRDVSAAQEHSSSLFVNWVENINDHATASARLSLVSPRFKTSRPVSTSPRFTRG